MKGKDATKPRVRVLQPSKSPQAAQTQTAEPAQRPKIRVAAYARTSTDQADQETSFEAQQTHFRSVINENADWELVDIYADEESGTRAFKRENFMRMIRDCEDGKIDLILTKSISRWARNTLDSLKYIRKLKAMGIGIIFTKEGINTMDSSGEVLITIMSSIAQQESASISQNIQIGVRYHYQAGKVCSGVYQLLGYTRTKEGSLEIIPAEAAIVRRIYREYLDGYTVRHIAERLTAEGVDGTKTTNTGIAVRRKWNAQGIEYILKNEKYSGDLLLQKYYTVDFLEKKVAANCGQLPQYYVENNHDPVIPKSIFLQVQAEMSRRKANPKRFRYMHENSLSGRIFCGECGTPCRLRRNSKKNSLFWRCETRVNRNRYPGVVCSVACGILDETVKQAVVQAFNLLPERYEELIRLDERLRWGGLNRADTVLSALDEQMSDLERQIDEAEVPPLDLIDQLNALQNDWLAASTRRAEYANSVHQSRNLRERMDAIASLPVAKAAPEENGACRDAETFFQLTRAAYTPGPLTAFSDDETIKLVERIMVNEDTITVVFKAGIEITVRRNE